MRNFVLCVTAAVLLVGWAPPLFATELITICYHNVRDDVDGHIDVDPMAVSTRQLTEQFEWLRQNNYHPVSIDQLEDARSGRKPLPPRAVLLSFDDGYESFYTRIFPLLKLYHYPAVMALVGRWLDVPKNHAVQYGDEKRTRDSFLTAKQIIEMQASGLVEFASHTYDSHKGILANPQGNTEPAVVTRQYDKKTQSYESGRQTYQRLLRDFHRNHERIKALTGVAPRVMVWPYGAWNLPAENAARSLGYRWFLLLGQKPDDRLHANGRLQRHLVVSNPSLADFRDELQPFKPPVIAVRVAHVDLDYVYDTDPIQMNANIDKLLDRIKRLHISTVYLQAFADPDGDGNADAVYFPNKYLPVRSDLFNRVAWQLKTRANVDVYAWMPVLAFDFGKAFYREHGVREWHSNKEPSTSNSSYRRLSLFDPVAREHIIGLYHDLAAHAAFQGVLFHDDALLDFDEDFHPKAIQWFATQGLNLSRYAQWKDNPEQRKKFTDLKILALDNFTQVLANTVKQYRPEIFTARNLYASTVLEPESEQWFAQRFDAALVQYNYVALMAMPWMEEAKDPVVWTKNIIAVLSRLTPTQRDKLVVELQARDWKTNKPISNQDFVQQIQLWKHAGYRNFAWYPDDFHANVPDFNTVFTQLSLKDFPYERK